jgi:hypothetical protein
MTNNTLLHNALAESRQQFIALYKKGEFTAARAKRQILEEAERKIANGLEGEALKVLAKTKGAKS